VVRHEQLARRPGDLRDREEGLDLGGEEKAPVPRAVVIERLRPEVVAREEECSPARVPDGEREVAQQVLRSLLAPLPEGGEKELSVGVEAPPVPGQVERRGDLLAVVEARVRYQGEVALARPQRPDLVVILRGEEAGRVAQADDTLAPDGPAVEGAVRDRVEHPVDLFRGGLPTRGAK
jgi:hypothetical protein